MKKNLFIFIICCLYFGSTAQNQHKNSYISTNTCLADSGAYFYLTTDPNMDSIWFAKSSRYFYTYDSQGNTVNTLVLDAYPANTWTNWYNCINTYNANNNLTDSIYQYWNGNQFVNDRKQHISYIGVNKPLIILNQIWSPGALVWRDYSRTQNFYDVSNKKTASKFQYWDYNNNIWLTDDSVQSIYNSSQQLVAHKYYNMDYGMQPPVLSYSGKDTLIYNSNNDPVSYLKKKLVSTTQVTNSDTISWVYDANNRLVFKSILMKNGIGQWQNVLTDFYRYDSNNRMIKDSSYYSGGTLKYYTNCVVPGFNELSKEELLILVYPNPSSSSLSISSNADYHSIQIVNLMGQTVLTSGNAPTISVSELSNGVYFIRILDKNDRILKTEKFIKN